MDVYKLIRSKREISKTPLSSLQNLFRNQYSNKEFSNLSDNRKTKMLDNYLGLLNARDNYEILLNRYNVAVKRNDKE